MPQEYLSLTPAYVFIGAFRLVHDPSLWKPMWAKCSKAAKRAGIVAAVWATITWPIQKWGVRFFMQSSAKVTGMKGLYNTFVATADKADDPLPFIIPLPSLTTFAAAVFVLGQCQTIIEFFLRRQLREFRNTAYQATVASRGKDRTWWTPYQEEWMEPPYAKAQKNSQKAKLYVRLASPIFRIFVLRAVLLPLDFIPFLSLGVGAYIRSLSYGRQLLTPFYAAKRMTPLQVEVFTAERQFSLRLFGFTCALTERIPLIGTLFSISNRVGAAMLAHDYEKRQQRFARGELAKLKKEETYNLGEMNGWKDLVRPSSPTSSQKNKLPFAPQAEDDFNMPGAVQREEVKAKAEALGAEALRKRPVPGVPASSSATSSAGPSTAASGRPVPAPPSSAPHYDDAPPAYSEEDALQAVGGGEHY